MRQQRIKKYTEPKIRYRYRRMSWDNYISDEYTGYRTVRSSIIPVTTINGETYWLLGSFWDFPKEILTDIGGACKMWEPKAIKGQPPPRKQERNRKSNFGCAIIELYEESKGLLVKPVLKFLGSLDNDDIYIYEGIDYKQKERVIFIFVPLDYNEIRFIPEQFISLPDPIYEKLGPIDFYAEEDILAKRYYTSRNLTDFVNFLLSNMR